MTFGKHGEDRCCPILTPTPTTTSSSTTTIPTLTNTDTDRPVAVVTLEHSSFLEEGNGNGGDRRIVYHSRGSSIPEAIFNFTNCIVGAGAIGLGGAMAQSGGFISIASIVFFAYLTKLSLDLVIGLSLQSGTPTAGGAHDGTGSSYEGLGRLALGRAGEILVVVNKFLYSFGCLVAYLIVVKDNLPIALRSLLWKYSQHPQNLYEPLPVAATNGLQSFFWQHHYPPHSWESFWQDDILITWIVSLSVVFPLCLLRDMTPLANWSIVSVAGMAIIVIIVIGLYVCNPNHEIRVADGSFYEDWLQVRWGGYWKSIGMFVFTFVSQHTAHLTFHSLKPEIRTLRHWKQVSSTALFLATVVSLSVGIFVYASFLKHTKADIFIIYPSFPIVHLAQLILCFTMLLTFPLPFFSCRELILRYIRCSPPPSLVVGEVQNSMATVSHEDDIRVDDITALRQPLLLLEDHGDEEMTAYDVEDEHGHSRARDVSSLSNSTVPSGLQHLSTDNSTESTPLDAAPLDSTIPAISTNSNNIHPNSAPSSCFWMRTDDPDDQYQLLLPYHCLLTLKLWFVATGLAVSAPDLGKVLDLIGCACGTMIAFILPAALAFRLEGYSHTALLIAVVGGVVGVIGTYGSIREFSRPV